MYRFPSSPASPHACHCADGSSVTCRVGPHVSPPSLEIATNTSLLMLSHGSTGTPKSGAVPPGPPLRKSDQYTASRPVSASIPIAGKSFIRYPFGGRHCRNSGQSLISLSGTLKGWRPMSSPTLTGELHVVPPSEDLTSICWHTPRPPSEDASGVLQLLKATYTVPSGP